MKPFLICLLLSCAASGGFSQAIRFSPLSFRDALAKARKENKPLFIEVYTTWCTYCKQMERDVFTTKEAGNYYNEHFICLRYDALKTDGVQIRNTYTLPGLPAFLYLSPNGFVLRKTAGFQPISLFLANADSVMASYALQPTLPTQNH